MNDEMLINMKELCELLKLSRRSIYRCMELSGLPRPKRINSRVLRWVKSDVQAWIVSK